MNTSPRPHQQRISAKLTENQSVFGLMTRVGIVSCLAFAILIDASCGQAEQPEIPQATAPERAQELKTIPWIETIEREIPPLANEPGRRLPMIMWHGVGFQPLSPGQIDVLRRRGLTQHLQLDVAMIPAALALQKAGMPVILMQGRTDSWPYSLATNRQDWAHQLDSTYKPPWLDQEEAFQWHGACPNQTDGWKVLESETRSKMQQFRDAGVKITGVWTDFEGDPYPWSHLFDQLKHCARCRRDLPADIVNNKEAWRARSWKQYVNLYDKHFARPIREVFPECLVTNWHVVYSTPQQPVRYFVHDLELPELVPQHFNATNPIAYGCDQLWHERSEFRLHEPTQQSVDSFYRIEILQQVRTDRSNRQRLGKLSVQSVPWVARYCQIDSSNTKAPMMTRASYCKVLGELWEMDIATMQVFNAMHDGYEEYALTELQDAVIAYDQSLVDQASELPPSETP